MGRCSNVPGVAGCPDRVLYFPSMLTDRFERALVYAMVVHGGATRKGTKTPYVAHLLAVTSLVLQYGGTEDEAIGALLHDAAEDGGGEDRLRDIEGRFGCEVAEIVKGCSDTFIVPKPPWFPRKAQYIANIAHESASTVLVSVADKLHNVGAILAEYRDVGETLWCRFNEDAKKDGTIGYYRGLVEAYQKTGHHSKVVADLDALVTQLEGVAELNGKWPPEGRL